MILDDVLKHFGNAYKFGKTSGMCVNNIYNWRNMGYIPIVSQMRLEALTNGVLKADMAHTVNNALR